MHRFYIEADDREDDTIRLMGGDQKHLANVLRINAGEKIVVSDNTGMDYICEVREKTEDTVLLQILYGYEDNCEPAADITLYQAVPKGDKMDYIIQKCVELGIKGIVPVITKRVVVKFDAGNTATKIGRWNKISREASKQSGRSVIPEVTGVMSFDDAVRTASRDSFCIFPYEKEGSRRLKDLPIDKEQRFSIFIGPEGGFDDDEVRTAAACGIMPVSLGKRILRTETAALAVLSIIMHLKGEI